ncbi:MAG TPA: hypothetical protein ENK39_01765 [Epsilonproteobacteria bacterium]|nr:hypothetical protein [Campylobacterota bacterium]
MHSEDFFNLLTQEYSIKLATSPQDFQAVKEVRREVFSHKYNMTPTLLENKGYLFSKDDIQSFIYLLRHNTTNSYVGTVRLFFINGTTPLQKLPMQKDGNVKDNVIKNMMHTFPICEISRLALVNTLPRYKDYSALRLRTYLAMLLMISTRLNLFLYHQNTIFAIMEPSLHLILKRQNVRFRQIGKPVEYYGIRTPFGIERKKLLQDTEETMGTITRHYLKELCQNPDSFWEFIDNNPYLERSDIQLDRICQLFKEYGDDVDLSLLLGEDAPSMA